MSGLSHRLTLGRDSSAWQTAPQLVTPRREMLEAVSWHRAGGTHEHANAAGP